MLNYLPCCIYVKFENADWNIHSKLDDGVYPMKPTTKTWVLNKQTDARIERKGFQLIPDYACTAHLIQGMTLEGIMADCGDVMDAPNLKRMLAAYVAMSRVRKADALLIV